MEHSSEASCTTVAQCMLAAHRCRCSARFCPCIFCTAAKMHSCVFQRWVEMLQGVRQGNSSVVLLPQARTFLQLVQDCGRYGESLSSRCAPSKRRCKECPATDGAPGSAQAPSHTRCCVERLAAARTRLQECNNRNGQRCLAEQWQPCSRHAVAGTYAGVYTMSHCRLAVMILSHSSS